MYYIRINSDNPNSLQALADPSQDWFEDQQIIVPVSQLGGQCQGCDAIRWKTHH
jgi:hypothetical protein